MTKYLFNCWLIRALPLLLLLGCGGGGEGPRIDNPLIVGKNRPMMVAHRGGAGEYPENTMLAFRNADKLGMDYLEMDVRLTADNRLVVHHDSLVDRTSDGFGEIISMPLEEIQRLNFANNFIDTNGNRVYESQTQRISTIEEVFEEFPDARMIIEIKNNNIEGELAASLLLENIIAYNKQDQVIIGSFHDRILDFFKQISEGKITTIAARKEAMWFYLSYVTGIASLYEPSSDLLALPTRMFGLELSGKGLIAEAHRRNLAVHYWTIDDPEVMKELIANGADGIMSDYPRMLEEVILP